MKELEFNPMEIWLALYKRRYIFLVFFLGVSLTGALYTLNQPKIYSAAATLEIGVETPRVAFFDEVVQSNPTSWWSQQNFGETQVKIVKSRSMLEEVARELLRRKVLLQGTPQELAGWLSGVVNAEPVTNSNLLRIAVEDTDPGRAKEVANVTAQVYMEQNLARRLSSAKTAVDWLSNQLQDFTKEKERTDRLLQEFREKHKLVTLENKGDIVKTNLASLNEALNEKKNKRLELQTRYEKLAGLAAQAKSIYDYFSIFDNPALASQRQRYVELEEQRRRIGEKYLPKHPEMVKLRAEIDNIENAVKKIVDNQLALERNKFHLAQAEEASIQKAFDKQRQEALKIDSIYQEYENIRNLASTNEQFYVALNKKLREADLTGLITVNNIRLVDTAVVPTYYVRPRYSMSILMYIIIGLIGGAGLAILVEYLDSSIKNPKDMEHYLNIPFLGFVPLMAELKKGESELERRRRVELVALTSPNSSTTECFRTLRTNIDFSSSVQGYRSLLFTSSNPREGKSTVVANLGVMFARGGKRTLIIDFDLRKPSQELIFGFSGKKGMTDVLVGQVALDDVIYPTEQENLFLIPAGTIPPNPAELIGTPLLGEVMKTVRSRFDKVLVDSPPLMPIADTLVLAQKVEATLLVVRSTKTSRQAAEECLEQLKRIQVKILGAVLNAMAIERKWYGKAAHYGYYYGYGYGYGRHGDQEPGSDAAAEERAKVLPFTQG